MDSIAIIGGSPLNGSIPVSGAKNSALKLMAASILTDQPLRLTNMPRLADTRFLGQLLRSPLNSFRVQQYIHGACMESV